MTHPNDPRDAIGGEAERAGSRRRQPRGVTLDRARLELERTHAASLAALLRQAAAVVVARSSGLTTAFPVPPAAARVWLRRARTALELAEADGVTPPGYEVVLRLVERPVTRWPAASRLAQAARRVVDGEVPRLVLGFALLSERDSRRATRVFSEILRQPSALRHRWRVLEGLALAHRFQGRARLALSAIEAAADDPRCGVSALVESLALALVAADPRLARRAAARLDLLVDPYSPSFVAACGRLRLRRRLEQVEDPEPSLDLQHLTRELARERRSPAGRVARALL